MALMTFVSLGYFTHKAWNVIYSYIFPDVPVEQKQPVKKEKKTMKELLKPFEKIASKPQMTIDDLNTCGLQYLGCKGRIFDVSSNEMYGPDGGYNLFVGKDSSVALAKMKFDKEFLDPSELHWSSDLNTSELNILEDWLVKFYEKYPLVGYIKDDGKK